MKKRIKNQSAPKTVSADSKREDLSLKPFGSNITMDDLRKALRIPDYHEEPEYLFDILIETKRICTRDHLKEMFKLEDFELRHVFYEGRRAYDRGFLTDRKAYETLSWDFLWDNMKKCEIPIELTPAQKKLRSLLTKRILLEHFNDLFEEVNDVYGSCILGELEYVDEEYSITEEELLDALNTYQSEHLA